MKKYLKLSLGAVVAALVVSVLVVGPARASVLGTWMYNLLTVNGPVTINNAPSNRGGGLGTLTVQGLATFNGGVATAGPVQLTVNTTTQLTLRSDPIGSMFLVEEGATLTSYASCYSTAPAKFSYVYLSTQNAAAGTAIGSACNQ